jgi:hypothetical protein
VQDLATKMIWTPLLRDLRQDLPRGHLTSRRARWPDQFSSWMAPLFDSRHLLKRPRAKHNQGFDRPASVTEVAVNFKIHVQRVGFNLCKSGLGAADWARVF